MISLIKSQKSILFKTLGLSTVVIILSGCTDSSRVVMRDDNKSLIDSINLIGYTNIKEEELAAFLYECRDDFLKDSEFLESTLYHSENKKIHSRYIATKKINQDKAKDISINYFKKYLSSIKKKYGYNDQVIFYITLNIQSVGKYDDEKKLLSMGMSTRKPYGSSSYDFYYPEFSTRTRIRGKLDEEVSWVPSASDRRRFRRDKGFDYIIDGNNFITNGKSRFTNQLKLPEEAAYLITLKHTQRTEDGYRPRNPLGVRIKAKYESCNLNENEGFYERKLKVMGFSIYEGDYDDGEIIYKSN